jgi:hypothetical protein
VSESPTRMRKSPIFNVPEIVVLIENCRGHFVWVNLGERLGFQDALTEKKIFQKLLDGGVYIVSELGSFGYDTEAMYRRQD